MNARVGLGGSEAVSWAAGDKDRPVRASACPRVLWALASQAGEGEGRTQESGQGEPSLRGPDTGPRVVEGRCFIHGDAEPSITAKPPSPATSIILPPQTILGLGSASPPPSSRPLSLPGVGALILARGDRSEVWVHSRLALG